jgi:hypothetical protein
MITRNFRIKDLEDVRLFVAQNMNMFTIILEEKINREWHPMIKNEHKIEDGAKFDLQSYILEAIKEYAEKKKIEEEVSEVLMQYENGDEIIVND